MSAAHPDPARHAGTPRFAQVSAALAAGTLFMWHLDRAWPHLLSAGLVDAVMFLLHPGLVVLIPFTLSLLVPRQPILFGLLLSLAQLGLAAAILIMASERVVYWRGFGRDGGSEFALVLGILTTLNIVAGASLLARSKARLVAGLQLMDADTPAASSPPVRDSNLHVWIAFWAAGLVGSVLNMRHHV